MLVLADEMFDSPPVFAWVLPVFVRLQPDKEETFSPASRIFVARARAVAQGQGALMPIQGDPIFRNLLKKK
jgi:hypothetical protein